MAKTLIIKHSVTVTPEYLLGAPTGFPSGQPLSESAIRKVQATMTALKVPKFEDGHWHGEVHPFGMQDMLESSPESKLEWVNDYTAVLFGIRWDVGEDYHQARVFGPKSDPSDVLELDLTEADANRA